MSNIPFHDLASLETYLEGLHGKPCEPGVDEMEHALQCAAELKASAPDDAGLQIAGLLHDIAHSLVPIGVHANVGGEAVRDILGARVAALVALHADAKRYLVTTDPAYRAKLSPVSIKTMEAQGGMMTADEVTAFEAKPHWREALVLRMADDAAKTPGRQVPGIDTWLPVLRAVAAAQ